MRRAALAVALALLAGCGGPADDRVTVFAAASLTEVLEALEADVRFNFAGSDQLAAQLREGARADVYASADAELPLALHREGLLEQPRLLCSNHVVLVVPRANPAGISSLADVGRDGVKVVITREGVPAGDYARAALSATPEGRAALANVVSEEDDVRGVVGKLALGEADAGFAYRTDVAAAEGQVSEVDIGAIARASYAIAVVADGSREAAERFLEHVFSDAGRRVFLRAGFVTSSGDGEPLR